MSRERGILFSAPMVRAILDGSKTQTRRAVKPQPMHTSALPTPVIEGPAPGYKVEGMVWFRFPKARWNSPCSESELARIMAGACPYGAPGDRLWVRETWAPHPDEDGAVYRATDPGWDDNGTGLKWRPSILMPRWASRITLEITEVRVQTSPRADVLPLSSFPLMPLWHLGWSAINGETSWQANPWLWCLTFKRVQP